MTPDPDLYARLEVSRTATNAQLKAAYRKLVKDCHPDRLTASGASAEEIAVARVRYEELNEAYQVLLDSEMREHYDKTGSVKREAIDAILSDAISNIATVLRMQIAEHADPEKVDLIEKIREYIAPARQGHEEKLRKTELEKAKLLRVQKRIRRKNGEENIVAKLLDQSVAECEQQMAHSKRQLLVVRKVEEILRDYSFDTLVEQMPAGWMTVGMTGGVTVNSASPPATMFFPPGRGPFAQG